MDGNCHPSPSPRLCSLTFLCGFRVTENNRSQGLLQWFYFCFQHVAKVRTGDGILIHLPRTFLYHNCVFGYLFLSTPGFLFFFWVTVVGCCRRCLCVCQKFLSNTCLFGVKSIFTHWMCNDLMTQKMRNVWMWNAWIKTLQHRQRQKHGNFLMGPSVTSS